MYICNALKNILSTQKKSTNLNIYHSQSYLNYLHILDIRSMCVLCVCVCVCVCVRGVYSMHTHTNTGNLGGFYLIW